MHRRACLALASWPLIGLPACGGGTGDDNAPSAPPTVATIGQWPISAHTALADDGGQLIVVGGDRGLSTLSEGVDRLDPATGQATRIAVLASGRASHSAVVLEDGRILVAGGSIALVGAPSSELVDPARGSVVDAGRLALSRTAHAATRLADGRVLLTGGTGRDTAELWDPDTRRWRLLASRLQHPRAGHSATLLGDGRVLVVGGDAGGFAGYRFAELWDPRTEAFTPVDAPGAEPRMLHAAWRDGTGDVNVAGGERVSATGVVPLASVWRFEAATARWVAAAGLAGARTLAASVQIDAQAVLLAGGQTPEDAASARLSTWTPLGGERVLPDLPGPRRWHTATRLRDGTVVVLGGEDGQGRFVPAILRIAFG